MDIKKYALFVDVAETKNFTKSGERMGYTQPGVSHSLKTMEDELGFPLFERTRQGLTLTPDAKTILPIVQELLQVNDRLEQTINYINGLEIGQVTIASFASISRNWLPAVISSFRQKHTGINIELLEGGTDDIMEWLETGRADFGLLSKQHTKSYPWIPLYDDPMMAILPKNYHPMPDESFPVTEMADKPFIISAEGTDYDVYHALEIAGVTPNVRYTSKDDLAIVHMVANNLGVSILSRLVIQGFEERVTTLPLEPYCSRQLGICMRPDTGLSPAARQFVSFIQKTVPELIQKNCSG